MANDGLLFLMGEPEEKDFLSLQIKDGNILLKACQVIFNVSLQFQTSRIKVFQLMKLQNAQQDEHNGISYNDGPQINKNFFLDCNNNYFLAQWAKNKSHIHFVLISVLVKSFWFHSISVWLGIWNSQY